MISRGIFEQIIFFVQSSRRKEKYGRDFGRFIYIYIYIRDEYERNEEEINWVIRDWWIARLYPRWKTFMRQVVPMCGGERKVRTKSVRTCNRIWNRKTTCITVKDLLAPLLYSKLSQTVRSKATLVARIRWAVQECIDLPWHTIWARDQVSTPLPAFYTVRRDFLTWIIPLPLSLLFVYISRIDQGRNHLDDERYDIRRITFLSSWLLREKHHFFAFQFRKSGVEFWVIWSIKFWKFGEERWYDFLCINK